MKRSTRERWLLFVVALAHGAGVACRGMVRAAGCLRFGAGAAVAAAAAVAAVVVGFALGAPIAGGSDSYGYVSQAHLWATGRMRAELHLASELVPLVPAEALVPLGYNLAADRTTIVPIYAAGLPLVMALFERLAGARAVFWVVPLLGGLAVWNTYLLGRRAAGPLGGALAAVLLLSSPPFLLQLTAAPMSDFATMAWWTLSLALLLVEGRAAALGAGLAAGLAILTRPNLAPLALVPGALLLAAATAELRFRRGSAAGDAVALASGRATARGWAAASCRAVLGGPGARRLLLFVAGVVPAAIAVALIYDRLYGSPLSSGYERPLFRLEHAAPNLVRYPQLLTELETPAIWLAFVAPLVAGWALGAGSGAGPAPALGSPPAAFPSPPSPSRSAAAEDPPRRRTLQWLLWAFAVAVFACYLFYPGYDAHETLRFLVPALPALMILLSVTLTALAARLPRGWRALLLVVAAGLLAAHGIARAHDRSAFDTRGEWKYAIMGDYVARRLPARAVLLSMQHSGSVRYYSGRDILRYDLLPPRRLDRTLKRLRRLGYQPYVLLEPWEVPLFRERFQRQSSVGALDWPPLATLDFADVSLWDPADAIPHGGRQRTTDSVPWPFAQP